MCVVLYYTVSERFFASSVVDMVKQSQAASYDIEVKVLEHSLPALGARCSEFYRKEIVQIY